jgi:fibronectin-binding autotransporter adhesin
VNLRAGGSVTNDAIAMISGIQSGIVITDVGVVYNAGKVSGRSFGVYMSAGVVNNSGTIAANGTYPGTGLGVKLLDGGSVVNGATDATSGLISARVSGVMIGGKVGTVTNYGTIKTTSNISSGIDLRAGGTVTNAAGALIAGVANGVDISGGAGTIANSGTIDGSAVGGYGVYLSAIGVLINGATNSTSALISGGYDGVAIGAAGSIGNFGTIIGGSHDGVNLLGGGTVINGAGGATAALIQGNNTAIVVGGPAAGTVANFGTILASGTTGYVNGIYINAGTVVNGATDVTTALVSSVKYGVQVAGTAGTVSNFGTILGTGATYSIGVYLTGGGGVSNAQNALISGMHVGAAIKGPSPAQSAIWVRSPGSVPLVTPTAFTSTAPARSLTAHRM